VAYRQSSDLAHLARSRSTTAARPGGRQPMIRMGSPCRSPVLSIKLCSASILGYRGALEWRQA